MIKKDILIIPSCRGLLDCFNNHYTRYYSEESHYCLQGEVNTPMVIWLFSFIYINFFGLSQKAIPTTWTFKATDFKRYIGYQKGGKGRDLYEQLAQLSEYKYLYNYMEQGQAIKVSFSKDRSTMTVESKYFSELYGYMKRVMGSYSRVGVKKSTGKPAYSSMVHSSIFKERSISGCEVAIEICRLIERRGSLKKGECAHISMLSLAERCPTLYSRMKNQKRQKDTNKVFRTALEKGLELLEKYTSIYDCFEDLKIVLPQNIEVTKECVIEIFYKK